MCAGALGGRENRVAPEGVKHCFLTVFLYPELAPDDWIRPLFFRQEPFKFLTASASGQFSRKFSDETMVFDNEMAPYALSLT